MRGMKAVAALAVAGVAAFVSAAAADPPTTTLYGCQEAENGLLKLVEEGEPCDDGWEAVAWLGEAPTGEQGAQGLPGGKGPAGGPGPDGADAVVPETVEVSIGDEAAARFDAATRTLHLTVPRGLRGSPGEQGPDGAPGPAGPFSGRFKSPNGSVTIDVLDAGIQLSAGSTLVQMSQAAVAVRSAGTTVVNGPLIGLNGTCLGVARDGDLLTARFVQVPLGPPIWLPATIAGGSTTVLSC